MFRMQAVGNVNQALPANLLKINPQFAFGSATSNFLGVDATTPELEKALMPVLDFSRTGLLQEQHDQDNAAVEGLVRAFNDQRSAALESQRHGLSTAADSMFSALSSPEPGEFSPSSPSSVVSASSERAAAVASGIAGQVPSRAQLDPRAQEELKKQRKKERNRVAAMKCRRRKIEREQDLDSKVRTLKAENGSLTAEVVRLRNQVYSLKKTVMDHIAGGCTMFPPPQSQAQA